MADLVLQKVEATGKFTEKGKLGANWDGAFKIICIIKPDTFELENLEGKKLQCPWHEDHLKKFFIHFGKGYTSEYMSKSSKSSSSDGFFQQHYHQSSASM